MIDISDVTGLPYRFTINGGTFDIENIEDVRKMPLVFRSFAFGGDEWYFNNFFRFCASLHEKSNPELASVLRDKADELENDPIYGAFMIEKATYILTDKRTWRSINLLPNLNSEVRRPIDPRSYVVNFENGVVTNLTPRQTKYDFDLREFTYVASRLCIDGQHIDLLNPNDVERIKVSAVLTATESPTVALPYILRFQAANIRKQGMHELSIAILQKSNEMYEQDILKDRPVCRKEDLLRLSRWLEEDGRINEALKVKNHVDELFQNFRPNHAAQRAALATGDALGYDAVEISAHRIPSPDHERVQGRVFFRTEFEKMQRGESFTDVEGRRYRCLTRCIADASCSHIAIPFSTKYSKRKHTDEELAQWAAENAKGCTIHGKHFTLYEASALMREIEDNVRTEKQVAIAARKADNYELQKQCQKRINSLAAQYAEVSEISGLPQRKHRMSVDGFRMIKL